MLSGAIFYDLSIPQRLMQSNILEEQTDDNSFSEKQSLVENETESYYSIPRIPSLLSAKELLHRKQRPGEIGTDSTSQTPNELTKTVGRNDYLNYLEDYNALAKKHGVRVIYPSTFKSSTV